MCPFLRGHIFLNFAFFLDCDFFFYSENQVPLHPNGEVFALSTSLFYFSFFETKAPHFTLPPPTSHLPPPTPHLSPIPTPT